MNIPKEVFKSDLTAKTNKDDRTQKMSINEPTLNYNKKRWQSFNLVL